MPAGRSSCPGCGAATTGAGRFCGRCGHPLVERPAARARRHWRAFAPGLVLWCGLVALCGLTVLIYAHGGVTSPWLDVVATTLMAAWTIAFARASGDRVAVALREPGFTRTTWWLPVAGFAFTAAFMWAYFSILSALGVESLGYLEAFYEHGWPLWSAFVLISLLPGIVEELAFRGVILERLERVLRPTDALIVQAAMFSVLHFAPLIFVSHFVMGLVFGWLRQRTGSLYPPIVLHAAWNAAIVCLELGDYSAAT